MDELIYPRLLLTAAARRTDRPAFVDDDGTTELLADHVDRSLRLADAHRRHLGLARDDRYAVLAGNSRWYVNLWHAAFLGGGVVNPLNTRLAPAELAFILRDSGSKVLYVDAAFAPVAAQIRDQVPSLEQVVLIGPGDDLPVDARLDDLAATGEPTVVDVAEDDLTVLMYTGGTTGLPKGVLHTQRTNTLNVYRMGFMFGFFTERSTFLNATPMFHAGGAMGSMGMPCSGGTTVIHGGFDPARLIADVERHQVTHTGLVPTMIGMVVNHPDFDPAKFATLRMMGYGASPMPAAVLDAVRTHLPHVQLTQTYGMTEACAVVTCLTAEDHRRGDHVLRSAGRAAPGVELTVRDANGEPVPAGEVGEVWAKAGSFSVGYLGRPEETAAAFVDGWYRTGDAGYLDDEQYLYLVDRTKDMIVTGGENVYSSEVENALSTHPAVLQVAVIGIPSERWGEQVHAVVVPRPGVEVTEDELIAHARGLIAGFKVPKSVELRADPLPLSGAMKVLKRELRAPYWDGRDRSID
jgi:acyl-CoA synthetase (AMP-forming)/AMP-acid ligase II